MKTIDYKFKQLKIEYDLSLLANPDDILFLDIETTGLSSKTASIYLIGVCYLKDHVWNATQWFAETLEEEADIISSTIKNIKIGLLLE